MGGGGEGSGEVEPEEGMGVAWEGTQATCGFEEGVRPLGSMPV
jgi:hypothetical protein